MANHEFPKDLHPEPIQEVTTTDTAAKLIDQLTLKDGRQLAGAIIEVTDNGAHIDFFADPVQGGSGITYAAGDRLILEGASYVRGLRYISAAPVTPAVLEVILLYT